MRPATRPSARLVAAAAAAGLLAGVLVAGCKKQSSAPAPGTTPTPTSTARRRTDPKVEAALRARADLAANRVFVLGFDGADPDQVRRLVADGRLPNFKRLLEEGAFGPLRSQQPMLSPLLWTTVATGRYPDAHGVLDFMVRDEDSPSGRQTVTSKQRQVEAMWDIASRYGLKVGLVGWLASHPAEPVNGFAVSERTELLAYLYRQKVQQSDEGKTWPKDLVETIAPLRRRPDDVPYGEIRPFLHITEEEFDRDCNIEVFTDHNRTNNMRLIYLGADNFRRIGQKLLREEKPRLFCSYFEAIDATAHYFQCFEKPVTWEPRDRKAILRRFENVPEEVLDALIESATSDLVKISPEIGEQIQRIRKQDPTLVRNVRELASGARPADVERYRDAVSAMYEWHDRLLGEYMEMMDENTILMVVSDHGFASGLQKPPFDSTFNSRMGGARYHHPHGIIGVFGKGVRPGMEVVPFGGDEESGYRGARLIDIAPTVLALLGFPKAEDMDGRVVTEIFDLDLAVGSVDTYETDRRVRLAKERRAERKERKASGSPDLDEETDELMDQLAAIGYVGASADAEKRVMLHLAQSYLQQGKYAEAIEAFTEALKEIEGKARLPVLRNRADLYRRLERFEDAELDCREILEIDPDWVPGRAAIAALADRRGDLDTAVKEWKAIVELDPVRVKLRSKLADVMRRRAARLQPEEREGELERALAVIDGDDPDADSKERMLDASDRNTRGMILLELRRFPEAMAEFEAACEEAPDYLRPRNNLGVAYMRLAHEALWKARRTRDRGERARLEADLVANRRKALDWFAEVLKVDPENEKAHYNRGDLFARLLPQDLEAARMHLQKAVDINPEYKKAKVLLQKINEALRRTEAKPGG